MPGQSLAELVGERRLLVSKLHGLHDRITAIDGLIGRAHFATAQRAQQPAAATSDQRPATTSAGASGGAQFAGKDTKRDRCWPVLHAHLDEHGPTQSARLHDICVAAGIPWRDPGTFNSSVLIDTTRYVRVRRGVYGLAGLHDPD